MKILFFCPRWGQAHVPWNVFAQQVKAAGYDGVETDVPADEKEREQVLEALAKHGLLLIAQHWETVTPDFDAHLPAYVERLQRMAAVSPVCINAQTGRDFFTMEQNGQLINAASQVAAATGIPVYHETHRSKFSFAAHVTAAYLQQFPRLQLTLDLSHWIAVAESFLQEQQPAVALAVSRTRHIHARVGHTQGPQVSDPRAPEWEAALQVHLDCWDEIVRINKQAGLQQLTVTAEFGPPPYMPLLPYTQQPVASQWDINLYMKALLNSRYNLNPFA
ncbi:MAG TPA: TIM barrel protein [Chitinophaga sp.]|uniref:sugar phosphate isomerase/epimerase family protein n=1 Tax=Chitinophaga sp. TaxID=1869181 RepID=UPI002F9202C4